MIKLIERKLWRIHPKVIEFWEKSGETILCTKEDWIYSNIKKRIIYYIYKIGSNYIATDLDGIMSYHLNGKSYSEFQILKLLNFKAFL